MCWCVIVIKNKPTKNIRVDPNNSHTQFFCKYTTQIITKNIEKKKQELNKVRKKSFKILKYKKVSLTNTVMS